MRYGGRGCRDLRRSNVVDRVGPRSGRDGDLVPGDRHLMDLDGIGRDCSSYHLQNRGNMIDSIVSQSCRGIENTENLSTLRESKDVWPVLKFKRVTLSLLPNLHRKTNKLLRFRISRFYKSDSSFVVTFTVVHHGLNGKLISRWWMEVGRLTLGFSTIPVVMEIFTMSVVPLDRMSTAVAECFSVLKPGLYDMTMLRFEADQRVGFREYKLADVTRSYFFSLDSTRDLFLGAGCWNMAVEITRIHYDKLAKDDLSSDFQKPSNFGELENVFFDFTSPPFQHMLKGADFHMESIDRPSNFSSFEMVKDLATRSRKVSGEKIPIPNCTNQPRVEKDQKMSTNARIRMAGQQFIDSYSSVVNGNSEQNRAFLVSFSGLSNDEAKDVKLLLTLLVSAEKPVNGSLTVRANSLTCVIKCPPAKEMLWKGLDIMNMSKLQKALMNVDASIFAFHQKVPLSQICQFSAMQTIIENVRGARKVHVIDLEIRTGMQYIVLMQALKSQCGWDIQGLKITAVGTRLESKIKETCNGLADFAKSMNVPFSFSIVMLTDILDFKKDLLELDDNEKVAIYSPYFLSSLIVKPNRLEHLMREIRKINPCITLISEVEANHTSPVFVTRFLEALFFYGALFDSVSDCLADDDLNRKVSESVIYSRPMRNIVAAECDERTIRHITIKVWRTFFERFGMSEVELSDATLNEAKLIINSFDCRNSCMLRVDGRCFVVGWKDVPIFSVSAWKFV
ncbi:DELLA protein RGL2 [Tanacetum coccineum]